jgi:hypothetical protein
MTPSKVYSGLRLPSACISDMCAFATLEIMQVKMPSSTSFTKECFATIKLNAFNHQEVVTKRLWVKELLRKHGRAPLCPSLHYVNSHRRSLLACFTLSGEYNVSLEHFTTAHRSVHWRHILDCPRPARQSRFE